MPTPVPIPAFALTERPGDVESVVVDDDELDVSLVTEDGVMPMVFDVEINSAVVGIEAVISIEVVGV